MNSLLRRFQNLDRNLKLFLCANVFLGLGLCIDNGTFNNYFKDVFHLDVAGRTFLELPRELPGFLAAFFVGLLAAWGDVRSAGIAMVLQSVGMLALGLIPSWYGLMLISLFVYSSGAHIAMPLQNSIGMSFARDGKVATMLGRIGAANTAALVAGSGTLLVILALVHPGYPVLMATGSIFYLCAGLSFFLMKSQKRPAGHRRWILKKRYARFYFLSFFYGGRKQLFLTFGPWVIVDVFHQPVTTITLLFFITAVLGIFMRPFFGSLIDRFGERRILTVEAVAIAFVCLGYAFAAKIFSPSGALIVCCACYVLDSVSNYAGVARATWLRNIVEVPEDLSPTLSLGISIDHIVSMLLPVAGGALWILGGSGGYMYVFLGGTLIALANAILAQGMKHADRKTSQVG